jgi:hypothetical protein
VLITPPNPDVKWIVQDTFANLTFKGSVEVVYSDDGTDQLFVIEQVGVIKVFKNNPAASSTSDYNDGEITFRKNGYLCIAINNSRSEGDP